MTIDAKNETIIQKTQNCLVWLSGVETADNINARSKWAGAWAEESLYLLFANKTVFFSPQGIPRSLLNKRILISFAHGGEMGGGSLGS